MQAAIDVLLRKRRNLEDTYRAISIIYDAGKATGIAMDDAYRAAALEIINRKLRGQ